MESTQWRNNMKMIIAILLVLGAASMAAEFSTDMAAAKKASKDTGKAIAVLVGATDGENADPTKKFSEEVDDIVKKCDDFVFARDVGAEAAVEPRASAWGVVQLPAIVVLDADGRTIAIVYWRATAKTADYLLALRGCEMAKLASKVLKEKADGLQGLEKVRVLHESLVVLLKVGVFANGSMCGHDATIKEIQALDPGGDFKAMWDLYSILSKVEKAANSDKPEGATKMLDDFLAANPGKNDIIQKVNSIKAQLLFAAGDLVGSVEALKAVIAAGPDTETGREAKKMLEGLEAGK